MFVLASPLHMSSEETHQIAMKIWKNECGLKVENLVHWNEGEEFCSLGIGHFIWYPKGYNGPFQETFPQLVALLKKSKLSLPQLLQKTSHCPWKSREEFLKVKESAEVKELRQFLLNTIDLQTTFIAERLRDAMAKVSSKAPEATQKFDLVARLPSGLYALMDYVNFKGNGTLETERYKNQGWGLLQVLEAMDLKKASDDPLAEFCRAAKSVLTRRVENSPLERNEARWLKGWMVRIDSYQSA